MAASGLDIRLINGITSESSKEVTGADPPTVMDRDRRLTGYLRGQADEVKAPLGFELNNPWKVEDRIM
ncbi:MAG: hypothetical protein M4579_002786 [Chaenotheca gracillima]|nr:MAG: hypothetical protein M4579_002786 [Chaenotheca gracillima]